MAAATGPAPPRDTMGVGRDPGAFLGEAGQDVLVPDVLVVEALRLLVGELHHFACAVRESFVHRRLLPRLGMNLRCAETRQTVFGSGSSYTV